MTQQRNTQIKRQQRATEIATQLKSCIANVLNRYPVEIAYLHGSVARGCPLPASDVDIALVLSEVPPPYERLSLELNIQAAIEDASGLLNIDVRTINNAPLTVQGGIVQEGILLYNRNKDRRVTFEALTRRKYFDYQPTAERMQRIFLEHIHRKGLLSGQSKNRHLHPEQSANLPT